MSNQNDMWAIVELMGHIALAGKITKPEGDQKVFRALAPDIYGNDDPNEGESDDDE